MKKLDFSKLNPKNRTTEEAEAEALAARRETFDWLQCLAVALIVCVVVFVFFVRIIDVNGSSMVPTLYNNDKMLVSGLFYTPKQGDVVVFKTDSYDPNKALVKRVIATEGQVVNIDFSSGEVFVDGVAIEEAYINEKTYTKLNFIGPKTVPEGCVFVMGDNRNASTDSRDSRIGMVDARLIIGRVYAIIYPMGRWQFITNPN